MLAVTKNNERNYDIKSPFARHRRAHSVGHCRSIKSTSVRRASYISSSDWALHRPRRLGRWGIHSSFVRLKLFTPWYSRPRSAHGKPWRIWAGHDIKNLARYEMKQFLIEQIPVLFFIAMFFLMLALDGG